MNNRKTLVKIDESLGQKMINMAWQIKETLRKEFSSKGYDITPDQFVVLLKLWENDGLTQNELSQRTCKNKSNLTRILDGMEKRNLIYRKVSKEDRRSFNIHLTQSGWAMEEELVPIAVYIEERVFAGIAFAQKEQLKDIFKKMSDNIAT